LLICDLQLSHTQTISSYALQATTTFACAPVSSVTKVTKSGVSRRTYAALSEPKKQLVCWEESARGADAGEETTKQNAIDTKSKSEVVYIQDLSTFSKKKKDAESFEGSGLLVVYADGHIQHFSEDLQTKHYSVIVGSKEPTTIVYAATATATTAKKSIFSNRSDIAISDSPENLVLFTVAKRAENYYAQAILVPVVAGKKTPKELLSFQLPAAGDATELAASTFSIHFPTGVLYKLSSTYLTTYNLTLTRPSITAAFPIKSSTGPETKPTSLLRISSSTVLVTTNDEVIIYDTKYASLQASAAIKSDESDLTAGVFLTTFISEMDLAVGYSQEGIVGVQLTRQRAGEMGGLLIDSIGRGVNKADVFTTKKEKYENHLMRRFENERARAAKVIGELRSARRSQNIAQFERVFAKYVGVKDIPEPAPVSPSGDITMADAVAIPEAKDLEIPTSTYKTLKLDVVKAILDLVFTASEATTEKPAHLTLAFFPPATLKYLLESGNFSTQLLPLSHGLVPALLRYDPTLRTLQWFLTTLTSLSSSEVLAAIQLCLSPSTVIPEGEDSVVFEIHRAEILRLSLLRLSAFPAPTVVSEFQSLPADTLSLLIRLLENELSSLGSDDLNAKEEGKTLGVEDVRLVTELLTAAVDAMGMGGMVLQGGKEVLEGIRENVDDALEIVEEVVELKGLLEEIFRHVDWKQVVETVTLEQIAASDKHVVEVEDEEEEEEAVEEEAAEEEAGNTTIDFDDLPVSSTSLTVKKKPAALPARNKRARLTAAGHAAALLRANSHRKVVVGHKKMLQTTAISKYEVMKHDRPVALSTAKGLSVILPLGALAMRRIVNPLTNKEVKVVDDDEEGRRPINNRSRLKREYWREGLAAGVYSVESMVV
jgi:hypothetical protein